MECATIEYFLLMAGHLHWPGVIFIKSLEVNIYHIYCPGSILVVFPTPDLSAEEEIVHKIAEMSVKLQHIDTLNDQRKLDLQVKCRPLIGQDCNGLV